MTTSTDRDGLIALLERQRDAAEAKLDKIQRFLDERADNISCAGYSVTEEGCYTSTLAGKIQGVLDE